MNRSHHMSYIHPSIITCTMIFLFSFLAYAYNKPSIDAWLSALFSGDMFWLFSSVMASVAAVAFAMCFD